MTASQMEGFRAAMDIRPGREPWLLAARARAELSGRRGGGAVAAEAIQLVGLVAEDVVMAQGETVFGPNGAGRTILLSTVVGLIGRDTTVRDSSSLTAVA